jgi:hypothetical protein
MGAGPFEIEWHKVDGVLSPTAREYDGVLEIRQVTAADAGQYRCIARSNGLVSEGYATLLIAGMCQPFSLIPVYLSLVLL